MSANPPRRATARYPADRRRARALAVQVLYELDLTGHPWRDALRHQAEMARASQEAVAFSERFIEGVLGHQAELDTALQRLAPAWPVEQLSAVDRNILRLALYELRHQAETPPKAVINEAVELAKTYGGETSSQFINGVLGSALAERMAEEHAVTSPASSQTKEE